MSALVIIMSIGTKPHFERETVRGTAGIGTRSEKDRPPSAFGTGPSLCWLFEFQEIHFDITKWLNLPISHFLQLYCMKNLNSNSNVHFFLAMLQRDFAYHWSCGKGWVVKRNFLVFLNKKPNTWFRGTAGIGKIVQILGTTNSTNCIICIWRDCIICSALNHSRRIQLCVKLHTKIQIIQIVEFVLR